MSTALSRASLSASRKFPPARCEIGANWIASHGRISRPFAIRTSPLRDQAPSASLILSPDTLLRPCDSRYCCCCCTLESTLRRNDTKLGTRVRFAAWWQRVYWGSPVRQRLIRGAFWSLIGAAGSRAAAMLLSIIIVRMIGREQFGQLAMVQSTIGVVGMVAGMGLGTVATKYVAELRENDPERAGRILSLISIVALVTSLSAAAACFGFAGTLASQALGRSDLTLPIQILAALVFFSIFDGLFLAILTGLEAFSRITRISLSVAVVSLFTSPPLVYYYGLTGAVTSQVLCTAISMVLTYLAAGAECSRYGIHWSRIRLAGREWRVIVNVGLPMLAANLLVVPVMWLANLMLIRSPIGYSDLALVRIADQLRSLVTYFPMVLLAPTLAIMANSAADPKRFGATVRYCLSLSALTVFPIGISTTLLARWLLPVLYGPEFAGDSNAIAWAMLIAGIQATGAGLGNVLVATGRMWTGFAINLGWALLFLGIAALSIPLYHGVGYLGAMAAAYLILFAVVYGWFSFREPSLMGGYPLLTLLIFFVVAIAGSNILSASLDIVSAIVACVGVSGAMIAIIVVWERIALARNRGA